MSRHDVASVCHELDGCYRKSALLCVSSVAKEVIADAPKHSDFFQCAGMRMTSDASAAAAAASSGPQLYLFCFLLLTSRLASIGVTLTD